MLVNCGTEFFIGVEVFVYETGAYKTRIYKKGTDLIIFGSKYKVGQVIGEDVNDKYKLEHWG